MARHWLSSQLAHQLGPEFPWGTIVVNVSGSLLIGLISGLFEGGSGLVERASLRDFLIIGVLGGYTTFSAFSLQTLSLARAGNWGACAANVGLSLGVCLAAVAAGYAVGRTLTD
jgi:CrcB protein